MLAQVGAQLAQHGAVDGGMRTSLGLVQTPLVPVAADAVEAFGLVEVEVGGLNPRRQIQEAFHPLKLRQRVTDQRVSVHDVNLPQGEILEPVSHVHVVQTALDGFVARVQGAVLHQQRAI